MYHLTDLPQFISDQFIIFFDPEATHLPNMNPSNPGKIINYIKNSKFVEKYRDQFTPLECFGCDLQQPFRGTTFRLPLRSVEVSCLGFGWCFKSVVFFRGYFLMLADGCLFFFFYFYSPT